MQNKANERKKGGLSLKERNRLIFYCLMIALPVLQVCVFYIYINFRSVTLAFTTFDYDNRKYVPYGFNNFLQVFRDLRTSVVLKNSIVNSLELFLITLIFGLGLSIFFSYYIYKKRLGSKVFRFVLYAPHIISSVVFVIMYKYFVEVAVPEIWKQLFGAQIKGLLANPETTKTTIIVFSIWVSFGTQVLIFSNSMGGISDSIIESAQLDGITPMKELFFIVIPSVWNTVVTFWLVTLVGLFTNQMALYTFYGETADQSLYTFGYYLYRATKVGSNQDYTYLSAMGLVLTAVAIPITLLSKRLLEKYGPKEY